VTQTPEHLATVANAAEWNCFKLLTTVNDL